MTIKELLYKFNDISESTKDKIEGGKADEMSLKNISKKFNFDISKLKKELEMGIEVEKEHTKNEKIAKEIATDHLSEIPNYYTMLKNLEKRALEKWKNKKA
jgi:hypothetical protein